VTLHVGLGTFRPVKVENLEEHKMHSEFYRIKEEDCDKINSTKQNGGKIIAVGTTSCRVLETVGDEKWYCKAPKRMDGYFYLPGIQI